MALLALTDENLAYLKHALRSAYPEVKSSHRAEALAAACGFRTNISALSSLKDGSPGWPYLVDVSSDRFSARLSELGYSGIDGSQIPELVRSSDMPDRIWISCKAGDRRRLDAWFYECQRRDIPFLYVALRRKYANIDWDCISTDNRHDDVTRKENSSELVRIMFNAFQFFVHGRAKKAMFDASSFVGGIKDVPIAMVPELADAMFRILCQAIKHGERERIREAKAPMHDKAAEITNESQPHG